MPELAELRLTADYINSCSQGSGPTIHYCGIVKNPAHKGTHCITPENPSGYFSLSAESRGKELIVYIHEEGDKITPIRMTMGMSGHFKLTNTGQEPKHAHLKFDRTDGTTLSFVDVRRFGKWKVGESWSSNRGPDPTLDPENFKDNIYKNLDKKAFDHDIHIVLMNQQYFNGIGNYLRAEILYRLPHINPFMNAREVIKRYPGLLDMCTTIPRKAYILAGGKLSKSENPFKSDIEKSEKFIRCYHNPAMSWCIDKKGRRFWFDPIWYDTYLESVKL